MSELELWAPVVEAPAYEVSTLGRVRRGEFDVASWQGADGYPQVSIELPGRGRPVLRAVHRLVLEAFDGTPAPGLEANHADGAKGHNALVNLGWVTHAANVKHAWATGLIPRERARRTRCAFGHLTEQTYRQRDRHGELRTYTRCARCRRVAARRARDQALGLQLLPFGQ